MCGKVDTSKSDILSDNGTACSIAVLEKNTDCSVAGFIIINEHGNTTFSKRKPSGLFTELEGHFGFAPIQAFSQEVTGKQGEYERVRGEGQHLLQLAHPQAVAVLQSHLQDLERAWLDLRGRVGESATL